MEVPRTQHLEQIISLYGRTYREGYDDLKSVEAAVQADIAQYRAQLPPEAFEPQVESFMDAAEISTLVRDANLAVLRSLGKPSHRRWGFSSGGTSISGADLNLRDVPAAAREVIDRFKTELGGLTKPAKVFPEKRHPLSHELTPSVLAYFETISNKVAGRPPLEAKIADSALNKLELIDTVLNNRHTLEHFVLADSRGTPCLFHTTSGLNPLRIQRGVVMVEALTGVLGDRFVLLSERPLLVKA